MFNALFLGFYFSEIFLLTIPTTNKWIFTIEPKRSPHSQCLIVALTSTPQTLFIVPTMLIRQLLFLGFYRLNAYSTGRYCAADFCAIMAEGHAQKGEKQYFSCGYTCYAYFQKGCLTIQFHPFLFLWKKKSGTRECP